MSERDRKGGSNTGAHHDHEGAEQGEGLQRLLADPRTRGAVLRRIQARRERLAAEREQAKAQEQKQASTQAAAPTSSEYHGDEIELCKSPTELSGGAGPVQKTLGKAGFTHWWIRTPDFERGMGTEDGTVPGQRVDPPGASTNVIDHKGRGNRPISECHPAGQPGWGDPRWGREDKACLQAEMALGNDTGPWIPPVNDCHDVVKAALNECAVSSELPGGGVLPAPHDMGEPSDGAVP